MASLWEAAQAVIGRLPWSRPVPARHSSCWTQFCETFDKFIDIPNFSHQRSPSWLYRRIHGQCRHGRIRWADFFRSTLILSGEGLRALVTLCDTVSQCTVISWNARWLVDGAANRVIAKREAISRLLAKGAIVCVQETHWSEADGAIWQHGLLFRNLQYTAATQGMSQRHLQL